MEQVGARPWLRDLGIPSSFAGVVSLGLRFAVLYAEPPLGNGKRLTILPATISIYHVCGSQWQQSAANQRALTTSVEVKTWA